MKQSTRKVLIFSLSIMIISLLAILIFLPQTHHSQEETISTSESQSIHEESSISEEIQLSEETTQLVISDEELGLEANSLEEALNHFDYRKPDSFDSLRSHAQAEYGDQVLAHQEEILQLLADKNQIAESLGYAYLPEFPAQQTDLAESAYQIDVPLILQSDPHWSRVNYGFSPSDTMRNSGCAITSLAMVESTLGQSDTTPLDILDWSGLDYWVGDEGTSWQIFEDFADEYGHQVTNHGDSFEDAMKAIESGQVVVASILPGHITPVGHILVIRGYDPVNELVYVNDPADNPKNMYSLQGLPASYFYEDGLNYWSYR